MHRPVVFCNVTEAQTWAYQREPGQWFCAACEQPVKVVAPTARPLVGAR